MLGIQVPIGAQKSLTEAILTPEHNVGKGVYTVDLENNKKLYWLDTESGLLGAFEFEGTYTEGDDSCDAPTRSMGSVFCNFSVIQWNTTVPLPHELLQEQRTRESSKVGREEEVLISNRPELMVLNECLEAHKNHVDLLYLTDSETSLQTIHKWIDCETKLNLSKTPEADVLKDIILKLKKRVEEGATTLLIKVKDHRGDPLNEETDIRAGLGLLKEHKETIWNDSTDTTVYQ